MNIAKGLSRRVFILTLVVCCSQIHLAASSKKVQAPTPGPANSSVATSLEQLSTSLQSVAKQVEPAVVQIFNSSFAIEADTDPRGGTVVSQERSSGSGILISSDGFIVTNAHVVQGSRRLWVRLNKEVGRVPTHLQDAKLIGFDRQTDLAVIKIDLTGLPFLKFADSSSLQQGQIVLAFGSPLGLENSLSMGIVSAVDRQLDTDSPFVFIQTDAAINPGNSGGPLVNTAGEVVGVNSFIFTKSGGNEGVSFAIPSNLVNSICRQIRIEHHVHHHQVGISVRAITPTLAQALQLPREDGVVIEDIAPESPAEEAGLKVGDIILTVHANPITSVRQLALNMYSYAVGDQAAIDVLRGSQKLSFSVPVLERADGPQRIEDLLGAEDSPLPRLGVLCLTIDDKISAVLPPPRVTGGVLVAAKVAGRRPRLGDDLVAGDVIHALNGAEIKDMASLKTRLDSLSADSPLVIQVERSGSLHFVVLEND
jgi:serine protease Do